MGRKAKKEAPLDGFLYGGGSFFLSRWGSLINSLISLLYLLVLFNYKKKKKRHHKLSVLLSVLISFHYILGVSYYFPAGSHGIFHYPLLIV